MFGFFKSAFRPFVALGQKIGNFMGIGRKVARPMGVVVEPLEDFVKVRKGGLSAFQGGSAGKFYGSVDGMLSDFKYPV
tara:strand:+ start:178 stop:411 length:234 start_codon:yes stop_codon:yes gene_type:complete